MYLVRSPEDLGRAIAELRRAHRLTQAELADRLGVDRSYLTKLERGHRSPLLTLLFDALAELDATLTVEGRDQATRHG